MTTCGAIARCKRVSTGCGHKSRSGCVLHWICGVKPTPKAGNTPLQHFIVHGLDKPGSSATVSIIKENIFVEQIKILEDQILNIKKESDLEKILIIYH